MSRRNAESGGGIGDVMHLPSLPDAGAARDMLDRLVAEFGPIAQRRGYRVSSLTEMCCCGDGVDNLRGRGGSRRRRARIMPPNVGGYNLGGGGRCSIHLRLRSPAADGGRHDLLPYDEVASTMAHELAHCRHGPHSAEFYELMGEIQRQRRVFLDRGVVVDGDNFPMGEVGARALGGGGVGGGARTAGDRRGASALAAERRHARGVLLGGGGAAGSRNRGVGGGGGGRGPPEPTLLPPREAARIAAERRLADAQWCLPCSEIIEILEDDSSESDDEEGGGKANDGLPHRKSGRGDAESAYRDDAIGSQMPLQDLSSSSSSSLAPAAKTRVQKRQAASDADSSALAKKASEGRPARKSRNRIGTESTADCAVGATASGVIGDDAKCGAIGDCGGGATKGILTIDLTDDRDDGEDEIGKNAVTTTTSTDLAVTTTSAALQNAASSPTTSSAADNGRYWSCGRCTLRNYRPLALSCEACGTTRGEGDDDDAIADLVRRDDERDRIVDEERRRSRADFGGFDIYGSARRTTSTMRHLT